MADLAVIAFLVAFFGIALALVKGCEHIIGPDVLSTRTETTDADETKAAA